MGEPAHQALISDFTLPDGRGGEVSLWQYKHRQPVVLVLAQSGDDPLVQAFGARHGDYAAAGAAVLAIVHRIPPASRAPFPVLHDGQGRITQRLARGLPAILLLGSFNELQGRWERVASPDHDHLLNRIAELELMCPECGVAHWPAE